MKTYTQFYWNSYLDFFCDILKLRNSKVNILISYLHVYITTWNEHILKYFTLCKMGEEPTFYFPKIRWFSYNIDQLTIWLLSTIFYISDVYQWKFHTWLGLMLVTEYANKKLRKIMFLFHYDNKSLTKGHYKILFWKHLAPAVEIYNSHR